MHSLIRAATISCLLTSVSCANKYDFVQEIKIHAGPDAVWNALVNPEVVKTYHLAPLYKIELKKGGEIIYGKKDEVMISGEITEVEPNIKLAHTFRFGEKHHPGTAADPDTLVTYEIRKEAGDSILKLTHSGFADDNQTKANVTGGWPVILKQLKESLEGKPAPASPTAPPSKP